MAWRSAGTPVIGAYWWWPSRMAWSSAATSSAGTGKSGKPCPRFTAPCSCASCDITVKMVVPTFGSLDWVMSSRAVAWGPAVYDPVPMGYTCRDVDPEQASHGAPPARGRHGRLRAWRPRRPHRAARPLPCQVPLSAHGERRPPVRWRARGGAAGGLPQGRVPVAARRLMARHRRRPARARPRTRLPGRDLVRDALGLEPAVDRTQQRGEPPRRRRPARRPAGQRAPVPAGLRPGPEPDLARAELAGDGHGRAGVRRARAPVRTARVAVVAPGATGAAAHGRGASGRAPRRRQRRLATMTAMADRRPKRP